MTANLTIFALSSAPGIGAIALVRISGPDALRALRQLSGHREFEPRMAVRLELKFENQILDDAIALYFAAPNSFTGEDVVELNLHGGRAVVQGVLAALGKMDGLRLAEPGEFTRRAFENEKLDLTQAEAIADLIHAETSLQRAQALGQLGGGLSDLYHGWAGRLTKLLAHAEAEIDFPDEDLPDGINQKLTPDIQTMISELQNHLNDGRRGERLRDGIQIAIIGAPNAGKSTLLNALAQRDVAIVTEIAGTTRDVIEVHLDLGGYPVTLLDTAGLRATDDIVEAEGIRRAHSRARDADLKLCLFDSRMEPDAATHALVDENSIVVLTKNDLAQSGIRGIDISATNGKGIDDLLAEMTRRLEEIFSTVRDVPSLTRARHREALEETLSALQRAITAQSAELIAEDLRLALRALGRITGRVDVEDLLDKIFRDFCIGK
ncbi:MAG TPA: tRNA uridine-5-carboxymethylaminomethyl(34) synthesis GTPase MnmE [Alphaproteobacteria bacterium]|nr:tRNA uridine-5-carboxymethylaminomethyl(34) synthesis GTPase MnmE [Alphaproteobacteria bacterium]